MDFVDNLILQVTGKTEVDALRKAIEQEEQILRSVIATYGRYSDQARDSARELKGLQQQLEQIDRAQTSLTTKAQTAGAGFNAYQRNIQAAAWALQDFTSTSGDLGMKLNSITNNIPMLLGGMGQLGMAVMAVATVGTSLYRNWDSIAGLFENRNPFPKASGDLDAMKGKLSEVSKELEKLQKLDGLNDANFARAKDLQREEAALKDQVEAREAVERLKKQRTEAEEQVTKAFHEALKDTGPKKILDALEADIKGSANPAVKGQFLTIFKRLNEGNRDALDALIAFAKDNPKYGDLAKQLEQELVKSMRGSGGNPMDDVVKRFKAEREKNRKEAEGLTQQGADVQRAMVDDMEKETREGFEAIFTRPMEDMIVRGRAAGVAAEKEGAHLKDRVEAEARRMFPELAAMFPKAFEGVVNAVVLKAREGVDKAIQQLQAVEGLTKAEAIRRLNMDRAQRQQENQEKLALDELSQLAGNQYRKNAALNPGMPALTPEMQRQMGQQIQDRFKGMGVGGAEQTRIARAMQDPRGQAAVGQAMDQLGGMGLDEATAMRMMPAILGQMRNGAGGVGQAINRVMNAQAQQQAAAQNQAMNDAALTPAQQAARARAQQRRDAGFRSVAPVAPGGGQQAQDGVQALAQVNSQIVQGNQQTNEALLRLAADTQRALARTQSQLAALARQKQQDGDSFLPVTW